MGCGCKTNLNHNNYTDIETSDIKSNTNWSVFVRWVIFFFIVLFSPLFIFPILYMLYITIIKNETINIIDFLTTIGKLIKIAIKNKEMEDVSFDEYSVLEKK